MKRYWENDLYRYTGEKDFFSHTKQYITNYEYRLVCLFRKAAKKKAFVSKIKYRRISKKYLVDISPNTKIGDGLYIGHACAITINSHSILGNNINIHKGATIGKTNRGEKKGTPTLGNSVYVGINATIVGNISIGDNVLIGPNAYVNFDVPNDSIVVGNPGKIIHSSTATDGYINRRV